jgi:hypothetical protein
MLVNTLWGYCRYDFHGALVIHDQFALGAGRSSLDFCWHCIHISTIPYEKLSEIVHLDVPFILC